MRQALVIARASLAEHSRRRLTLVFLLLSVTLTAPLVYLARSPDIADAVSGPRGLAAAAAPLRYLALFAALASSMGNIGHPLASGEALLVLARPVAKWQYALGRLLGSASFVVGFCLALATETAVVALVAGQGAVPAELVGHWAVTAFNMVVAASIATLVSAVVANPVIVAAVAFFAYQTSAVAAALRAEAARLPESVAGWVEVAWLATPKLLVSPLTARMAEAVPGTQPVAAANPPALVLLALAWLAALALGAMWITSRRDV